MARNEPNIPLILQDAVADLPNMVWKKVEGATNYTDARFIRGEGKTWVALVVDFDISDQGFPPGTRGYDGTMTKKSALTIIHLPREVAEEAFKKALKSLDAEEAAREGKPC